MLVLGILNFCGNWIFTRSVPVSKSGFCKYAAREASSLIEWLQPGGQGCLQVLQHLWSEQAFETAALSKSTAWLTRAGLTFTLDVRINLLRRARVLVFAVGLLMLSQLFTDVSGCQITQLPLVLLRCTKAYARYNPSQKHWAWRLFSSSVWLLKEERFWLSLFSLLLVPSICDAPWKPD